MSCLKRAGGDQVIADQLYDTGYFNYYYRLLMYNNWAAAEEEAARARQTQR